MRQIDVFLKPKTKRLLRGVGGVTLVEMMIAMVVLTTGIISYFTVYTNIARSIQVNKSKTLAVNLAQEKIESMKNLSYHRLMVTINTVPDTNFNPAIDYDVDYYPSETIVAGGISFQRRAYIRKVAESSGNLVYRSYSDPDTGLKEITVHVVWREGNEWKKVSLRNLRDDPSRLSVDSSVSGEVKSGALDLADARVEVVENTVWFDTTDSGGDYSFRVAAGSYTLKASKAGYFSAFTSLSIAGNEVVSGKNFDLIEMASGTISGTAYIRDHLVIAEVVSSSNNIDGQEQEWVMLYNPTSFTWTMTDALIDLIYADKNGSTVDIPLTYINTSVASGTFYLFANTNTVQAAGEVSAADAIYSAPGSDIILNNRAGGIILANDSGAVIYDRVAWTRNAASEAAPAAATEGSPIQLTNGLGLDEQIVRSSITFGAWSEAGYLSWDTNNNRNDFNQGASPQDRSIFYPSGDSSDTGGTPIGGTPAGGAIVFADDNLAPSVLSNSSGVFQLMSVATGTWTLTVSSGSFFHDEESVTVTASVVTDVGVVILSSVSTNGYISGQVTDALGAGIGTLKMAASGASPQYTDASGYYRFSVSTGNVEVVANHGNDDPTYISASSQVVAQTGQLISNVNFTLSQGGGVTGWATTNGTDSMPGLVVTAELNGLTKGSDITDSNGLFTILNLSTGAYDVTAYPDAGESVTPSTLTATVTTGDTVFAGTFTVANALGTIVGTLTNNGVTIKTGVLLTASTDTVSGDPPVLNSALRTGTVKYYGGSSMADGTYEIRAPGGYTYNVYGWFTSWGDSAPSTTTKKNATAALPAGGTVTGVDLSWP